MQISAIQPAHQEQQAHRQQQVVDRVMPLEALWSQQNAEVQRLIAEEAMLVQDLAAEQNRWTDFNQRLEELERTIGRQ